MAVASTTSSIVTDIHDEQAHVYRIVTDINDELDEIMDSDYESEGIRSNGLVRDIHRMLMEILSHLRRQFTIETDQFFPGVVVERPESAAAIDALRREHAELLASLESIIELADSGYADRSNWISIDSAFQAFTWSFASHRSRKRLIFEESASSGIERCI